MVERMRWSQALAAYISWYIAERTEREERELGRKAQDSDCSQDHTPKHSLPSSRCYLQVSIPQNRSSDFKPNNWKNDQERAELEEYSALGSLTRNNVKRQQLLLDKLSNSGIHQKYYTVTTTFEDLQELFLAVSKELSFQVFRCYCI